MSDVVVMRDFSCRLCCHGAATANESHFRDVVLWEKLAKQGIQGYASIALHACMQQTMMHWHAAASYLGICESVVESVIGENAGVVVDSVDFHV